MKTTRTVSQLLENKDRKDVLTTAPAETVFDALRTMAIYDVGALIVTADNRIVGIFSERDYARKLVLQNRSSRDTTVGEVMEKIVPTVIPDTSIEACLTLMTEHDLRHLPVVSSGWLVGIISRGDVLRDQLNEQEFMLEQMNNYVCGAYAGAEVSTWALFRP